MADRIDPGERSGVLEPANLVRFAATWHAPDPRLADVVETYWHVAWSLGDEAIDQRIVEAPAVTLSIEHGDVPWSLVGALVVALPLLTALVVSLTARSRLPLVARLD